MLLSDLKICLIDSLGPHYRLGVYKAMGRHLNADFYFGNRDLPVKVCDYDSLNNYKATLKVYKLPGGLFVMPKALKLAKMYDCLILAGDPYALHNWVVPLFRRALRKRTILWTHGWYGRETWLKSLLKKILFYPADLIWLYGEYARSLMVRNGFSEKKLVVIYNSLDFEIQEQARQTHGPASIFKSHFRNCNKNIIFIGRLTKKKRLDLIIHAAAYLEKHYDLLVNVTFAGDIIDDSGIEEALTDTNIRQRVWMFGPSYEERANCALLTDADVCVSPGNVGLTAIHALTYGCPVITHDDFENQMPEFEAIEPGLTGAFFRHGDVKDLARKIYYWVTLDKGSRIKVRQACQEMVKEKWNPRNQAKIMSRSISELFPERQAL